MQAGGNGMKGLASGLVRWWWAAFVAVVVAAGVVIWGPATRAQGAEQRAPAGQAAGGVAVKTAKATEGSISADLTYTGDVKAVTQVTVQPKGSGRIEQLLVDVGSRVKKGDVIAQLDTASLKAQVSQARANLAAAQAKYASMKSGSRDEQIAQAKAAMEAAQAAADAAEARANIVKRGATDNDIQNAQGAVNAAQANLEAAKAKLDGAKAAQETVKLGPTQEQWWAALSAVDTARATVKEAETKLAEVKAGYKPADIQAQEALVEQYRAALYAADDKKSYASDHNYLFPDNQMTGVPGVANLGVTSASQADRAAYAALKNYDAAVAKLEQMKAYPQPADVAPYQAALDRAKAAFEAAANKVDQMKRGPTAQDLQQAQAAVDSATSGVAAAQASLLSAQATLKKLQDGPTEDDIKAADASVNQAKSALAQAEQAYLLAQNPYTQNDLNQSSAAVAQAQAMVDQAEIGLSEATIVSPVDGIVSDRPQSVGNLVGPQTPIVSILSNEVELVLGVEESQIGQVQEGQRAQISVAAYPGVAFPAKVALIAPSADAKSRTFQVKVRPEVNDGKLKQGMFAQVTLVTQEKPNATVVPKEAVVTKAGQTSVFVATGDTVQQRQVKTGLAKDNMVEILSGVKAGEEVVVAGQNDLRDGDKIRRP